ncbi:MAG TPA: 2-hydroxyglutaryl-CoA dehydratase, partial [Proteobacteria bacterium]|nr:2-hydroxyglutaryl-CoA dehydratase [Pseudomonadota bacterium]
MVIYAGLDIGSLTVEAVLLDASEEVVATGFGYSGARPSKAAERVLNEALAKAGVGLDDIFLVATGYGRISVPFAEATVTEITCHAKGAHKVLAGVRTVIDIGGQDSKAIALDGHGRVIDFAMNDKCAAGTGRFLEVMAKALEVPLEEMAALAMNHKKEIKVSSTCTVFAESEVISLLAEGHDTGDILWGVIRSIASRIAALAQRVGLREPVMLSGGVAKNEAVKLALEDIFGVGIFVPPDPQIIGALGAALIAKE